MILDKITNKISKKKQLRKMGFLQDQQGIIIRYLNEKDNWDNHLENTKKFILKSSKSKKKGKVVVLGSGWLLDIPVIELSEQFNEVILVDIIHPKQVQNKIKAFKNVFLVEEDISGGMVDNIFQKTKSITSKEKSLLQSLELFNYQLAENTDFVISLNIMVQLHIILNDYIKRFNLFPLTELLNFEKEIQKSHLGLLPIGKSCLITDMEEEILNKTDQVIGVNPLIHIDLPEGNFSQNWQWKFDTKMTYRENHKTYFNTRAIDF